jgi:glycosyltransferase involved in cell wall biosynthesis
MNHKPKLLIAVDTYYPKIDGTLKFVEEFVKRVKNDFDYKLLVPNYQNKKDNSKITYLKISRFIKSSGYTSVKVFSFSNLRKIKNSVKEAELVFVQGPAVLSTLTIFWSRWFKKKCVYYLHVNLWEFFKSFLVTPITKVMYKIAKPLLKISLNLCSLVLIPYQELKSEIKHRGIRTKIQVARLGVDIDKFSPVKDKAQAKKKIGLAGKTVIGYVGRVSNEKNVNILLEAFKKLENQSEMALLMVGDGPENQVKIFKDTNNCKVTGFVNNVQDYLKATDIFVMPSLTETTSLATLEAMSCGLPVIVTKVGFMKNYIVKDHNGIFFPKNSSTMLAAKLEKFIREEELRETLGRNARKTIAYSFSWERSINKIKRILMEVYYK